MDTSPDDFRILPLKRDRDALLLIALGVVVILLVAVGLAFLPDEAWNRLEERSKLLWGALVGIVPLLMVARERLKLRQAAVTAMGKAASAPITITPTAELVSMEDEGRDPTKPILPSAQD